MKVKKVIAEGHRGYCARYPENTMISYEAAIKLGVDAIEFDVWLTKDGVPVLMHDDNCNRTCGVNRSLRDMTLEEVKELEPAYCERFGNQFTGQGIKVPTLEELLIFCKQKKPDLLLGVEIKEYTEETVDMSVELLKQYGFLIIAIFMRLMGELLNILRPGTKDVLWGIRIFRWKSLKRILMTIMMNLVSP